MIFTWLKECAFKWRSFYLCCICHSTWRGECGGGGAFRLRGVVPPCTEELPDGSWGGFMGVGIGSQTNWYQAWHKMGKPRKLCMCIKTQSWQQRGMNASGKSNAHTHTQKNNDFILENMHNMIGQSCPWSHLIVWGHNVTHSYGTLPPRLQPQKLRTQRGKRHTASTLTL